MRKPKQPDRKQPRQQRKPNDLSHCLAALDNDHTLVAVVELSCRPSLACPGPGAGVGNPSHERSPATVCQPSAYRRIGRGLLARRPALPTAHTEGSLWIKHSFIADKLWSQRPIIDSTSGTSLPGSSIQCFRFE